MSIGNFTVDHALERLAHHVGLGPAPVVRDGHGHLGGDVDAKVHHVVGHSSAPPAASGGSGLGVMARTELQAPARHALDLQRAGERDVLPPLRNRALGDTQLPGGFRRGPEVINHELGAHGEKFSALYTKCKTAEPEGAVGYSAMNENTNETRGSRIKYLRRSKGLTQQQLADTIGVTKGLVSQWENDQIGSIGHENWMALLEVLGAAPEFLEHGADQPRLPTGPGARKWRKQPRRRRTGSKGGSPPK